MTAPPPPPHPAPRADALKERVIVVTGAGDGLGRSTALACAAHGATVVLLGRTVAKLEKVYDEIRAIDSAPEPAIYPMNLAGANVTDFAALAETLDREFGRLDGLVHAAAHFKGHAPLGGVEPRDWLESLQVNLTSAWALLRECLPLLSAGPAASVVLVSDRAGREGRAYTGAYGVSKFALEGLMRIAAQELEAGGRVRINTLDPGPMETALRRRGYADVGSAPSPEAAAAEILWLLSPASAPLSGQALCVAHRRTSTGT